MKLLDEIESVTNVAGAAIGDNAQEAIQLDRSDASARHEARIDAVRDTRRTDRRQVWNHEGEGHAEKCPLGQACGLGHSLRHGNDFEGCSWLLVPNFV